MPVISANDLRERVFEVLCAANVPEDVARQVGYSLVESNLVGHDSHGVMRVPQYIDGVQKGDLKPKAETRIIRESASTALLDGGHNFGQVVAARGMEIAVAKAREHDMAAVVLGNCDHTGRIGEYVVMAAEQGLVGLCISNGSLPGGLVAPIGGAGRALGANPMAWGIPAGKKKPIFFDFATSAASAGKIHVAADKGQEIPEGWLLDKEGHPTRDPNQLSEGGVMLPFGGHKGYALSVMIELVCGGLSGMGFPLQPEYKWEQAAVLVALSIRAFRPLEEFVGMISDFAERLKSTPRAPGCDEILLPGEPEWRCKEERELIGIPLPEVTWRRLSETAKTLGVDWPDHAAE
jgi:uncharacterized oxidoreductase